MIKLTLALTLFTLASCGSDFETPETKSTPTTQKAYSFVDANNSEVQIPTAIQQLKSLSASFGTLGEIPALGSLSRVRIASMLPTGYILLVTEAGESLQVNISNKSVATVKAKKSFAASPSHFAVNSLQTWQLQGLERITLERFENEGKANPNQYSFSIPKDIDKAQLTESRVLGAHNNWLIVSYGSTLAIVAENKGKIRAMFVKAPEKYSLSKVTGAALNDTLSVAALMLQDSIYLLDIDAAKSRVNWRHIPLAASGLSAEKKIVYSPYFVGQDLKSLVVSEKQIFLTNNKDTWNDKVAPIITSNCVSCHSTKAPILVTEGKLDKNKVIAAKQTITDRVSRPTSSAGYMPMAKVLSDEDKNALIQWLISQ